MRTTSPTFVVADVGGTNTRVALFEDDKIRNETIRRIRNTEFANLAPLLRAYCDDYPGVEIAGACVCIAGPVADGVGSLTNLNWSIDEARLAEATGARHCAILNDLQAQGHALSHLTEDACDTVISGGAIEGGSKLVIGVGTGFNAAPVHALPNGSLVPPCEAGHANLPIRTEADLRLCNFVSTAHGFPAVEDVLSGRGLEQVYRWLAHEEGSAEEHLAADIMTRLPSDPRARAAVAQFIRLLGTVAGNLSLIHLPLGGVYFVGGVARAMGPHLAEMGFSEAFRDKGRFAGFMANFSVSLVTDDFAALTGCAAYLKDQSG